MPATTRSPLTLDGLPLAEPGAPDLRSGDRFLLWIASLQRWPLLLGATYGILWMGSQAVIPAALGLGVQAAVDGDRAAVLRWALVVLALGVFQAVTGILRHRMAVANWIGSASRVQQIIGRHASAVGGDLSRQVATGEVVALTANDVERIGSAFDVSARLAGAIAAFIGVAVVLIFASPILGVIVLVGMPLLALAVLPVMRPLEQRESKQREMYGAVTELAADTVAGLRVLRGIGGEQLFLERYHQRSQAVRRSAVDVARIRSVLEALQVALPGALVVTVTYLGARLAIEGVISPGELVAFYGYTAFLVLPLRTLTDAIDRFVRARVAARRIVTVLSLDRLDVLSSGTATEPPPGVSLHDPVSGVTLAPGLVTGIACEDPAAADRLADVLGGYRDGKATLGGLPLSDLPLDVVRRRIVVQDKDPVILSGTVRELLDVSGSGRISVTEAIGAACAQDVVDGLGDGIDAELPERGRTLSGGQRQRLSLARSYVSDPDVLLLNEPTSAVDAHTEALIASRARSIRSGRTTAILSASPLVLEQCDVVLWAPEGVVVGTGSHRDLLRDARYRHAVSREDDA